MVGPWWAEIQNAQVSYVILDSFLKLPCVSVVWKLINMELQKTLKTERDSGGGDFQNPESDCRQ